MPVTSHTIYVTLCLSPSGFTDCAGCTNLHYELLHIKYRPSMPPRTRSAALDVTLTANKPSVTNAKTSNTRAKKLRVSKSAARVDEHDSERNALGDITDRYVAPKSPTSTAKSNVHTTQQGKLPTRRIIRPIQSSLPPSSPPSTSSQIPNAYQFSEIQNLSSGPIEQDFDEDDPFGFFAAEEKLKSKRAPTALRGPQFHETIISSDDRDESLQQAFATPKPRNPLLTPRKRNNARKRKLSSSLPSSSSGVNDDEGKSWPSTPSPRKHGDISIDAPELENGKGAEVVQDIGKRGRKKRKTEGDMNPVELARFLEARLPRRPKKDATKPKRGRGRPKRAVEDENQAPERKKQKEKGKGKRKAKPLREAAADGSGGVEGEDEQQIRERQARIDYFKRLDGFEVQREDVYIV